MIEISGNQLIGEGRDCRVYQHPGEAGWCVKVLKADREGALKRALREIAEHRRLEREGVDCRWFSRFHDTVPTNFGQGYVYDLIRDADGRVSSSLKDVIEGNAGFELEMASVYELFRELYSAVSENGYVLSDMHVDNCLVKRGKDGNVDRLVIIDGMGNADFIKYCHWFAWLRQKKTDRKFTKMLQLAGLEVEEVISSR